MERTNHNDSAKPGASAGHHATGLTPQEVSRRLRRPLPKWLSPYLPTIVGSRLFSGITQEEAASMLGCLRPRRLRAARGEYVVHAGDELRSVPLVLEGGVSILREDWWGNRNIQNQATAGETFGVSYALTPGSHIGVSVVAEEDTTIAELAVGPMLRTCSSACPYHMRLLENLVGTIAHRNLQINAKLSFLSQRSTRDKLLAYLSAVSQEEGSASFDIPYNRQQLADYLSVNRSAMSSELSHMADEGLIAYKRNHFTLLRPVEL